MSRLSEDLGAAAVADPAALTGVAVDLTFTTNAPTPSATQTIADGTVPTVAELGQLAANSEVFQAAAVADILAIRTQLVALITALENAKLVKV